ncbi:MAG: methionine aminopeptidase [Vicingaceae bacterium]|nr:MAG: methionine aminopeptidase [Vicingaceae bacterium]GIV42736.1 MAG: methionine aminopeptidase [Vicingaceae bacterium]
MIYIKTEEEIELIKKSSLLVCETLAYLASLLKPGITTLELDKLAEKFIRDHGGVPSFKGYHGYPFTLCTSVNDKVVHGFPSKEPLKEGDIVSIDCGVFLNGFHGDVAYTFAIGNVSDEAQKLMKVTKEALYKGIEQAVEGKRIGDIGYAIQSHAESNGFSVVRELVGHGLGKNLHEEPEVPNYGKRGHGVKLCEGMVIAIEPMVNFGSKKVKQLSDGWTIATADGSLSAHYEHDVCVKKDKALILSDYTKIEENILKNENIYG